MVVFSATVCVSVASAECYRTVERIVLEAKQKNPKMAVVVSAMGGKPKVGRPLKTQIG
jgi:aspartokinase